jgi:hydrogenase expression/formation protein HypD
VGIKMTEDIAKIRNAIHTLSGNIGRSLNLMEVCGTHTVAIFRHGIRGLLPEGLRLISGPGCPVCVTSIKDVDVAIELSRRQDVVLTTFGDMMRVPGGTLSLYEARAQGGDVRVVYSPLDALELARKEPGKKVVFFATGFETTSPLAAGSVVTAEQQGVDNFFVHPVHKLVPPALKALLDSGETAIDGLILPGHVSTIIGSRPYRFLAEEYKVPSVITGFDARDILEGIFMLMKQIYEEAPSVEIQYNKVVREEGNPRALEITYQIYQPASAYWRGIGEIPDSGLVLTEQYEHRDALKTLGLDPAAIPDHPEPTACSCGEVLRGIKIPTDCPLYGKRCTPDRPVGACMVSTEGSCAAYYKYGGHNI